MSRSCPFLSHGQGPRSVHVLYCTAGCTNHTQEVRQVSPGHSTWTVSSGHSTWTYGHPDQDMMTPRSRALYVPWSSIRGLEHQAPTEAPIRGGCTMESFPMDPCIPVSLYLGMLGHHALHALHARHARPPPCLPGDRAGAILGSRPLHLTGRAYISIVRL